MTVVYKHNMFQFSSNKTSRKSIKIVGDNYIRFVEEEVEEESQIITGIKQNPFVKEHSESICGIASLRNRL